MDNNNGVVVGVVALIVIFLAVVGLAIFNKNGDVQQAPQPIYVNPSQPPVIVNPPPRHCPPGQPHCPPPPPRHNHRPDINIQINPGHDHRAMYQMGYNDGFHHRAPNHRHDGNYMRGYRDGCAARPGNPHFRLEINR
jgi:hypothetical protein